MGKIEQKDFDKILSIIPQNYPSINIFHICDRYFETVAYIEEFSRHNGYSYDLFLIDESKRKYIKKENYKLLKLSQRRYNRQSKKYEYVFVDLDLNQIEKLPLFFKKIYELSKNGAKLLMICKDRSKLGELYKILEDEFFVAINPIDDVLEDLTVITARKMHGWGG